MFNDSITYLRSSDEWVTTVLIGGVLSLLGFLIVPAILVVGYLIRVLRARMHGEAEPPVFDEWGEMLREGAYGFAIAVVYGIIPIVLGAIVGAIGVSGALAGDGGSALFGGVVAVVGGLVVLVLSLAVAYVLPAALANYAETGRFGAAFSVGGLRPVLTTGTYATAWATGFVIVVVAAIVGGVLNIVPILGGIVGAFLTFYAVVAAYYCVGTAWGELRGMGGRDGSDSASDGTAV